MVVEGEAAAAAEKGFSGLTRGVLAYVGGLVSAIELGRQLGGLINQYRDMAGKGVNAGDWFHAGLNSIGLESDEALKARFKDAYDTGRVSRDAFAPGKEGAEADKKAAAPAQSAADAIRGNIPVWDQSLKGLDDYREKLAALQTQMQALNNERAAAALGVDIGKSREELDIEQRILEAKIKQLDPMNKLRETWADQLASAQAYTKEQQNQVELEKAMEEARKANPRDPERAAAEAGAATRAKQAADTAKAFAEEMTTARQQLAIAGAITQTEKDRLEVEQKIADLKRTKGYSDAELGELQQALDLTKQIERETAQFKQLNPQASAIESYREQLDLLNSATCRSRNTPARRPSSTRTRRRRATRSAPWSTSSARNWSSCRSPASTARPTSRPCRRSTSSRSRASTSTRRPRRSCRSTTGRSRTFRTCRRSSTA